MADTLLLYMTGFAAEEAGDYASALGAYERGAALGDDSCWLALGYLYDVGRGVKVDKGEAMRCYRKAWRVRSSAAANNIAILYRERGDHQAMFRWFQRGAGDDDGAAHLNLAKCYRDGKGVRKSPEAMVRCLAVALASRYISEDDLEEAEAMMAAARPRLA
jgi:TPR repeat protein